ncbi:MAG: hypothetical protein WCF33_06530 [Pseudonocardiaceae bacterium]
MITSGVVAITTTGWNARWTARLARETRLAESYLEVLRIVEREGQWVEASITNWTLGVEEAEAFPDPGDRGLATGFKRVRVPEPAVTDRATIAAHLAAFGSPNVCRLYKAWRFIVKEIDKEEDVVQSICDYNSPDPPGLGVLKNLKVLQPKESAARQALADAIAGELGHL